MNWSQMQRRCVSARFVCAARLPGYRFAIARHSRLRNCGTANVFLESGGEVWGIVYDVSEEDMSCMDGFEDGYVREKAFVYAINGQRSPLETIIYIAPRETSVPLPNSEYKRLLLEGASYWQLPPAYCRMLELIQAAET